MGLYLTFDIGIAVLSVAATVLFSYAVTKRRDLRIWLPAYVLITLGQIIAPFSLEKSDLANTAQLMFSLIGVILIPMLVGTIKEYLQSFFNSKLILFLQYLYLIFSFTY